MYCTIRLMKDFDFVPSLSDPSMRSELDKSLKDFDFIDRNAFSLETGETYWRIEKSPDVQQFVALMIKGIVTAADVIKIGDAYYSKDIKVTDLDTGISTAHSNSSSQFPKSRPT